MATTMVLLAIVISHLLVEPLPISPWWIAFAQRVIA